MGLADRLADVFADKPDETTDRPPGSTAPHWMLPGDAAPLFGRAHRTIRTWRRHAPAAFRLSDDGVLELELNALRAWALETGRITADEAARIRPPSTEADDTPEPAEPATLTAVRIRKERALAEKHELAVQKARGELLPRSEVMAGRLRRIEAVKAGLLGLSARLPQQLVGMNEEEMSRVIESEAKRLLLIFAGREP